MGSKPSKISASRISSILGLNKFKTEFELWLEIMEEEYPCWLKENGYVWTKKDISNEPAIRIGNLLENYIIKYISFDNAHSREKYFENGVNSCHVDAIMGDYIIESKTTNLFTFWSDWGKDGTDQIPDYYYCQVQTQMGLSGLNHALVPVLIFPDRQSNELVDNFLNQDLFDSVSSMDKLGLLKVYTVFFNNDVFEKIIDKSNEWWNDHIVNKTPPTFSVKKEKVILPLHGEIEANEDILNAIRLYKEYENNSKEFDKKSKKVKNLILNYMLKNANTGRSGFIRIRKDDRVLASYNTESRRFSIKGERNQCY